MSTLTSSQTGRENEGSALLDSRPLKPPRQGRAWPIVATREVVAKLTDKNFLISTAFTLVLIVGMLAFQAFMAMRTSTDTVVTTSPAASTLVAQAQQAARDDGRDNLEITATPVSSEDAARAALDDGSADAWLHQRDGGWVLTGKEDTDSTLAKYVGSAVRDQALAANATRVGTSMDALTQGSTLATDALRAEADPEGKAVRIIAGIVFAALFYMASLMFGMGIASSVVEEKQSRIIEILATAIPVRELLIGKVLGNTVLALAQMILFVGVALIGVSFTPYRSMLLALAGPSVWFLVYFLVGFLALACIWAVCGALCSRSEDLQQTTMPMSLLLVAALFGGISATGTLQVVLSYVPIASSLTMPARLLAGTADWWEPIVSLAVTGLFAAVMIVLGERIYRRALLQTGGRLSLRQAMRLEE